ncbi:hypothetical protein GCM10022233_25680 [Streptomyces shaanxiensis]|uniref:Uncharacterized protein n=1 Tax=Streptomyces shaanxiensis TaxID=653357 RepID=A0ABP7UWZ6_9ACTN
MLPGEVRRPELIPSAPGLSPLGRMGVPYIYPVVSGTTVRAKAVVLVLTGK